MNASVAIQVIWTAVSHNVAHGPAEGHNLTLAHAEKTINKRFARARDDTSVRRPDIFVVFPQSLQVKSGCVSNYDEYGPLSCTPCSSETAEHNASIFRADSLAQKPANSAEQLAGFFFSDWTAWQMLETSHLPLCHICMTSPHTSQRRRCDNPSVIWLLPVFDIVNKVSRI